MSYALCTSDINSLIYQYFLERGLHHSAFLLKNEAEKLQQDLPSGQLISYLEKSLAMEELERHKNEKDAISVGLPRCKNEFRLNHLHDCIYDSITEKKWSNGSVDELKDFIVLSGHTGLVTSLFSRKGVLISGSKDGTVRLWNLTHQNYSYRHVNILPHILADRSPLEVLTLDCNQYSIIASLATDGVARLWTSEGDLFNTIQLPVKILSLEWDSSGMYLLVAHSSGLSLWDSEGIQLKELTSLNVQSIKAATWRSPTEFTVLSESAVWVWRHNEEPQKIYEYKATSIKWSPNKTYLTILHDNQVGIYQDEYDIWYLNRDISAFQFSSKDYILIAANLSSEIYLWDLESRSIINKIVGSIGKILKIVLRKDDEFMAACSEDEVQIWYMENHSLIRKIKVQSVINNIVWIEEGNRIAVCYLDKIAIYSLY